MLSQKEDVFLLQDNLHVVLDPELEMYREKGILNGQEVAMLKRYEVRCVKALFHSSLVHKRSISVWQIEVTSGYLLEKVQMRVDKM